MKFPVAAFLVLLWLFSGVTGAQTTSRGKPTDSRPRRVEPVPATTVPKTNVAAGEEVSAGDVIRISTDLVTVPVSVLDRDGRFVPGLKRKDFRVFEDGVEQTISYFEPTESPFTVALVLDVSASTRFHLWEIKEAAIAFAKQLRPQDRVLVVTFSDRLLVLTEATNDQEVISSVIETNVVTGRSTRLYDAVDFVINQHLNKLKGRKAIVLFTDGVDTSSHRASYESTLREVEEVDALIYPIEYDTLSSIAGSQGSGTITIVTGGNWPFPGNTSSRVIYGRPTPGTSPADYKRGDEYLQAIAYRSGGRLYKANDSTQLAQAFTSIAEELRRQYRLGYYPQSGIDQGEDRRQLKVSVARPNVAVRARNSYKRRTSTNSPVQ
jgi:VWFA-related protein